MQFESAKNETFEIQFKDIQKIEKDPNSDNGIKITLHKYFDSQFYIKSNDRKKLMNEIKKYWKLYIEEREKKLTKSDITGIETNNKGGVIDSIKKIIFGN